MTNQRELNMGSFSPVSLIFYYLRPEERLAGGKEVHADYMNKERMRGILVACLNDLKRSKQSGKDHAEALASIWLSKNK